MTWGRSHVTHNVVSSYLPRRDMSFKRCDFNQIDIYVKQISTGVVLSVLID